MTLEVKNISFKYEKNSEYILKDFNLKIENSDRMGIMAPSGYGKTTLCKLLSGYEKPYSGEVLLEGKQLGSYRGYCPVQLIWQHPREAVNPRLTMRRILDEGHNLREGLTKDLGIKEEWLDRYPQELSEGELQRFCIARALGEGTQFLLADEITTMLDTITQSEIWHFLMEETARRKIGMLIVSHNKPLLNQVCTGITELHLRRQNSEVI